MLIPFGLSLSKPFDKLSPNGNLGHLICGFT